MLCVECDVQHIVGIFRYFICKTNFLSYNRYDNFNGIYCWKIAVLSFCADKLPLKICIFKKALYDFKADRLFKNNLELIDIIDIVLNWETLPITVFRMIQFDRCFLFNAIAAIVAHSVIYYQLTDKEKTESANACSCLQN